MKNYIITRSGEVLGKIAIDEEPHQPTYTVTDLDGKTSAPVNTFKNKCVMCKYLEWNYPGAKLEKVTA